MLSRSVESKVTRTGAKGRKAAADAPRARRARSVADLLPMAGGAAFRRFGFVQSSIVSRWREIVGVRYAAVSSPESIRFPPGKKSRGVLTLVVEGAHAPMMQHVAPTISGQRLTIDDWTKPKRLKAAPPACGSRSEKARARRERTGSASRFFRAVSSCVSDFVIASSMA